MEQEKNKILVVEDEASLRKVLMDKLSLEGYDVLEAPNGQEGLAIALKERPNLILLDILMPVMDGLSMLQALRKGDEYGQRVPVILLTNLSADTEDIIRKVAETAPAYYIVKASMPMQEILKKVKEFLGEKK